jgi:hypothetical protein
MGRIAVDLISPWKVTSGGQELNFSALTCIDPVSNLVKLIRIENKLVEHVGMQFKNQWLA